ncbi:MAG TPA: hypothetical protein VGB77_15690 [Abditibacteriaceae bacterium]
MLSNPLRDNLHKQGLSRKDKILVILSSEVDKPKTTNEIKQIAVSSGLRTAKKWNIASILVSAKGQAIHTSEGWILTTDGKNYLTTQNLLGPCLVKNVAADLRQHITTISDVNTKHFLQEAIGCLEADLFRAAVVFSWVGAIALLYEQVIQHHLIAFNTEAKRRDARWRDAVTSDDLARMKEHDFLDVIEAISIIGKNVKQELQNNCLKLRNACGHPNSLKIGQRRVAAHIEILIQNVFSKF